MSEVKEIKPKLSDQERKEFAQLESGISEGLQTFLKVGGNLLRVRDARYYRENYNSFEHYCREKWGISRKRAYDMIDAASAVSQNCYIVADVEKGICKESHAAILSEVPAAMRPDVWKAAKESAEGKPTAQDVRNAVNTTLGAGTKTTVNESEATQQVPALTKPSEDSKWKNAFGGKLPVTDFTSPENFLKDFKLMLSQIEQRNYSPEQLAWIRNHMEQETRHLWKRVESDERKAA